MRVNGVSNVVSSSVLEPGVAIGTSLLGMIDIQDSQRYLGTY